MVWPEVEQVMKHHRYELILSGEKLKKYLEEKKEIDETIWKLKQLNFLELSYCSLIEDLPANIGQLTNLTTLTLANNRLKEIPSTLKCLHSIRHLNVSFNQLENLPEDLFENFDQIETINFSNNQLKEFPSFNSSLNYSRLAIVNLSHNQLTSLKDFPRDLENLSHLDLSSNQFQFVPTTIFNFHHLKILLLDSNEINEIPSNISQLNKLKDLRFKSNPIKDNRLKKLMEQDKIKQVLEYLHRLWIEQQKHQRTTSPKRNSSKKEDEDEEMSSCDQIEILHFDDKEKKSIEITMLPNVVHVRPYLLCCIIHQLNFSTPGNLKKFLNLQNELHDEICQKRTLATIGTHDLSLIKGNLVYNCKDPNEIGLIPLGKGPKTISAKDFYDQLYREAEHERKLKKRNQLSGLHKYLTLLDQQNEFAFLSDEDRHVISLPPLTNCEQTKLSPQSESILVEISSSHSMDICRRVMDSFLHQILQLQLSKEQSNSNHSTEENRSNPIGQVLRLQQVRIVDDKGQLKTTFPSRTDLNWKEISQGLIRIQRLFP